MYERDPHYHSHVRRTRRGLTEGYGASVQLQGTVVGVIEVDPETGDVSVKTHDECTPSKE